MKHKTWKSLHSVGWKRKCGCWCLYLAFDCYQRNVHEDCGSRLADHCGIPSGRIFVIKETSKGRGNFIGDALKQWAIKTLLLSLLLLPLCCNKRQQKASFKCTNWKMGLQGVQKIFFSHLKPSGAFRTSRTFEMFPGWFGAFWKFLIWEDLLSVA